MESADACLWYGGAKEALGLLARAEIAEHQSPLSTGHLSLSRAGLLCRLGRLDEAGRVLRSVSARSLSTEIGFESRRRTVAAQLAVLGRTPNALQVVEEALRFSVARGTGFFTAALDVVRATLLPAEELDAAISLLAPESRVYLTIVAETVVPHLHILSPESLAVVSGECIRFVDRWRGALRESLLVQGPATVQAAKLLEEIGTAEDIPVLRKVARTIKGKGSDRQVGHRLARRLAPRVFIEDQGRVRVRLDGRAVVDIDARRKVLTLICYLLTRPQMSATRDEVIEAIWPEADPSSGLNSLNQTIYFLRRVLEPGYVEDTSPNYIHHDSDVVWLDAGLVTSRSIECRRLIDTISDNAVRADIIRLSKEYKDKFALDFAYEEWATPFRETLHAAYLQTIEAAILTGVASAWPTEAIALARRALEIDPTAEQLERLLLRAYHASGASAAAYEQYSHYAAYLKDELGVDPPSLDDLLNPEGG